jgi:hypothetical protein
MSDEIIFPYTEVNAVGYSTEQCYNTGASLVQNGLKHYATTTPYFTGSASTTRGFSSLPSNSTRRTYGIYKANPYFQSGPDNGYSNPTDSGAAYFKVSPCIEKIKFTTYGRRDRYKSSQDYDTIRIIVDGSMVFARSNTQEFDLPPKSGGVYTPALTSYNIVSNDEREVILTEPKECGHSVHIYGASGDIANGSVGYDVAVECFFRTQPYDAYQRSCLGVRCIPPY